MESKTRQNIQGKEEYKVIVEFYATPYIELIKSIDWRGVLLKTHIKWLGQELSHCGLRIISGGLDLSYQATWSGLRMFEHRTIKYTPKVTVDVTHSIDPVTLFDVLEYLFKYTDYDGVQLNTILLLMKNRAHEVDEMICTSFVAECLGFDIDNDLLYPDYFCEYVQKWSAINA